MIQGTASDVGKSVLVAALCRIYSRRGLRVAPFKSQNMALNSFVTPEGREIGRAQAVQAQAAGVAPHVDMNPVLLKPEGNGRSQVVLMGRPWKNLPAREYFKTKDTLWAHVAAAADRLVERNDLIVAEGAGSPAEINLKATEIVNMRVARHLGAPVFLVGDIDRGGVFAALYGTYWLLDSVERQLVRGFVMNKFRGDVSLLGDGLAMLAERTEGRPTVGVVPMLEDLYLAREDSVFLNHHRILGDGREDDGGENDGRSGVVDIAVIRLPHISNYDDFDPLGRERDVRVRFVDSVAELGRPAAVLLPGSKTTRADLAWLRSTGLAGQVMRLAGEGCPIAGICGGYQMLGTRVEDPDGVEGDPGAAEGLGLLPVLTRFRGTKTTRQARLVVALNHGFWANLAGTEVSGYEIHMGESEVDGAQPLLLRSEASPDALDAGEGVATADGRIWGCTIHGLFDNDRLRRAWLLSLGWSGVEAFEAASDLREREIDRVADHVEAHLDMRLVDRVVGL